MKNIVTILLAVFLIIQILDIDFDYLFDSLNKRPFINVLIAALCLISYQMEKKNQATKE